MDVNLNGVPESEEYRTTDPRLLVTGLLLLDSWDQSPTYRKAFVRSPYPILKVVKITNIVSVESKFLY